MQKQIQCFNSKIGPIDYYWAPSWLLLNNYFRNSKFGKFSDFTKTFLLKLLRLINASLKEVVDFIIITEFEMDQKTSI